MSLRRIPHRKVQTSFFKGILVESSSNARRFFFKKKSFSRFQNLVCFFRFPSFFVLTCCKLGALDFIILLRFHSNRIIQTRIFLYVCTTPAAVAAAVAPAEPAAATPPPRRPPPPRPSPPWSPPPRPPPPRKRAAVAATRSRFGLRTQNSNQHILYGCRVGNSK
jgi:hypothetical protein